MKTKARPETETQPDAVLQRLERVIRRSNDFVLGFVKSNSPMQRKDLSLALQERVSDKRLLEVELDKPIISLLDEITARWDAIHPPDAVCVYGLEKSINEQREASPVLGRLNHDRDLIRQAVPAALLIWLPDFALDYMARGAPDFWAWRSGVYEFPTDEALWQMDSTAAVTTDWTALSSLALEDKQKEITRLEELLRTARALRRQGKREQATAARLLYQLGLLHYSLGEWDKAQKRFEEGLVVSQDVGNKRFIAAIWHQLGNLQYIQGNIEEAARLYEQSLKMTQELGDKANIASTLHQLAMVELVRGDLQEAEQLYNRSLQIAQELGDARGISITLHNLADIEQRQGHLQEAMRLYNRSLQITHELGDASGIAAILHQLANLLYMQGNLPAAEQGYQQSLQIRQKIGDKHGIASTLGQMGSVRQLQGELPEAWQYYKSAWLLFRELQSPYARWAQQHILRIRDQVGDEQFQAWLKEDFGQQANEIIEALEQERAAPVEGN